MKMRTRKKEKVKDRKENQNNIIEGFKNKIIQ